MTRTYRAAVITRPGTFEVRDVPRRDPGAGEVRVLVDGCGACGSDLPVWTGAADAGLPLKPGAPGHEAWGVVDAVGADVTDLAPGDPVAGLFLHGYAQEETLAADRVVALPPALADEAFPGEPLACAMNAIERADVGPGDTVAVVGVGFLGALLTKLAASAGARVVALSRRPFALDVARKMGADETFPLDDDAIANVTAWTDEELCDRVIEVTGHQAPLDVAAALTRTRGRLVIAGYHQDGPRTVDMQMWNWRGIDVVNAHERDPDIILEGVRRAVDAVITGRLHPRDLLTHEFPLDDLDQAFEAMQDRPTGFLKAVVIP